MALTQVKSDGIATGAVTAEQIAANAVTVDDIADGSISTAKLADDAVTADKLADTAVTAGSYGSASAIPAITVDAQGRITAASTNAISVESDRIFEGNSSVEVTDTGSNGTITFTTEGSPRATIDSSGRLLVNTTTPSGYSDRLATFASTAGTSVEIRSGTTAYGQLAFSDSTAADSNSYAGFVRYDHDINSMRLGANGADRIQIGANGQFGIGGANYGTSGQVLTSQGNSAAPQWASAGNASLVVGTQQSASGNSSISFESFPTNTQKIEIILYQVSWNISATLRWQLGDFGGYETSGYFNQTMYWLNGTTNQSGTSSGSFGFNTWTGSGHGVNAVIRLYRRHTTGQNWHSESFADSTLSGTEMHMQVGTKDLSASLDRVQVFPSSGASFDNGFIQFNYWTV